MNEKQQQKEYRIKINNSMTSPFVVFKKMNGSDWVYIAGMAVIGAVAAIILDGIEGVMNGGLVFVFVMLIAGIGLGTRIRNREEKN